VSRDRRDHSTVHAGGGIARVPPVTSVTARRNCPEANGRRSSGSVRLPAPLTERSTSRSVPASGRTSPSPLFARHTACVTTTRAPNGRFHSPRAAATRRTASRANARAPQSSWRSASLAPGGPPRHSHHQPCRVPMGRALGAGSRRGPCCSNIPSASDPLFPRPASTSSAARAPSSPARHAHSAPNAVARNTPQSCAADAASARAGPLRAGSASERKPACPPRTRNDNRVSPATARRLPSARQRPRASLAHSAAWTPLSNVRLVWCSAREASAPSDTGPAPSRTPARSRRPKRPASSPPSGASNSTPEPERPRNRARWPRSSGARAQGSAAPPRTSPRPQSGDSCPAASRPPTNGDSTRPPPSSGSPSRNVPRAPPPWKLTRWERLGTPVPRLEAPTASSNSSSASESGSSHA